MDTSAITFWLTIIAIASVVQVAMVTGAAIAVLVMCRRTISSIELLRQQELQPLVQRLNTVLDDVHDVAGRVKATDDHVRGVMSRTADRVGYATALVGGRFWPLLGAARGIWAAIESVRHRGARRQPGMGLRAASRSAVTEVR